MKVLLRRSLFIFLILALFLSVPGFTKESAEKYHALLSALTGQVVLPAQLAMQERSHALVDSTQGFCAQPTEERMKALRQEWKHMMRAWQSVQMVRFGPMMEDSRDWKFQFWPDDKNLVRKKVRKLLSSDKILSADEVSGYGVPVRGLPALEYLLFDEENASLLLFTDDPLAERRCALMQSLADYLHGLSVQLNTTWKESYAPTLVDGDLASIGLENRHQVFSDFVSSAVTAVEILAGVKVARPLGLKSKKALANAYYLESWRSQTSLENLHVNLSHLRALFEVENGFNDFLVQEGQADLAKKIALQFQVIDKRIGSTEESLFVLLQEKDTAALQVISDHLLILLGLLRDEFAVVLNVQIGFNATDGD